MITFEALFHTLTRQAGTQPLPSLAAEHLEQQTDTLVLIGTL